MREDVAAAEGGQIKLFDGPDFKHDITAEWAANKKKAIDSLERIIAAYERINS